MEINKLRNVVRRSGHGLRPSGTSQSVIVDLNVQHADQTLLDHLKDLGLSVESVIENKVIGTIGADDLEGLRRDKAVREVELSVPLRPHDPRERT